MNSPASTILQGPKSRRVVSRRALQNYFSAQFSVCKAVNYLYLLCLFKPLNDYEWSTGTFKKYRTITQLYCWKSRLFPPEGCLPYWPNLSFTTIHEEGHYYVEHVLISYLLFNILSEALPWKSRGTHAEQPLSYLPGARASLTWKSPRVKQAVRPSLEASTGLSPPQLTW